MATINHGYRYEINERQRETEGQREREARDWHMEIGQIAVAHGSY